MGAGKQRRWDMISSHSSVGVIIYHTHLDALLVVRQFRPAVRPSFSLPCYAPPACAPSAHYPPALPMALLSQDFTALPVLCAMSFCFTWMRKSVNNAILMLYRPV